MSMFNLIFMGFSLVFWIFYGKIKCAVKLFKLDNSLILYVCYRIEGV